MSIALNSDDDMLLIRLISKTGCNINFYIFTYIAFELQRLSTQIQMQLIQKAVNLLQQGEFLDILIPCMSEVNYKTLGVYKGKTSSNDNNLDLTWIKKLREVGEKISNISS